ncbi:MAG: hypothetical protein J7K31_01375 [Candidatus Aenigmarchaeota archaeon]|nr:hypothetical protein [Candidatus Aenigmarchaeota archaeon]
MVKISTGYKWGGGKMSEIFPELQLLNDPLLKEVFGNVEIGHILNKMRTVDKIRNTDIIQILPGQGGIGAIYVPTDKEKALLEVRDTREININGKNYKLPVGTYAIEVTEDGRVEVYDTNGGWFVNPDGTHEKIQNPNYNQNKKIDRTLFNTGDVDDRPLGEKTRERLEKNLEKIENNPLNIAVAIEKYFRNQ